MEALFESYGARKVFARSSHVYNRLGSFWLYQYRPSAKQSCLGPERRLAPSAETDPNRLRANAENRTRTCNTVRPLSPQGKTIA
jgi:hypothetical protein